MVLKVFVRCDYVGDPLGDAPSIGVLCSVYKARCSWSFGSLGKSKCPSDTREPGPHNRISIAIYSCVGLMV